MDQPIWVSKAVVLALHEEQLAEHGGSPGLRDEGLLESAMARPRNLFSNERPDISAMAAAYAYGIVTNHPFVDVNKRASAVVAELFLDLNGFSFEMDDAQLVTTWLSLAAGEISETELADRIRASIKYVQAPRA